MYYSSIRRPPGPEPGPGPEPSPFTARHWIIVAGALAGALLGSFAVVLLLGRLIN